MPRPPRRPLALPLLALALAAAGCLPSPDGGGVLVTDFLADSEDICGGDSSYLETVRMSIPRWTYDSGPFTSDEFVGADGVRVEVRVGDAVCSSERFHDEREVSAHGPDGASIWLVMEADGALFPVRVVDGDGAVWAIELDPDARDGFDVAVPRSARVTAAILRSARAIQRGLRDWLPDGVDLPALEIVWEEGVTRECPACIVDGRIQISDEPHGGQALPFWAAIVERQVVRAVLHHRGLIEAPISGQLGVPQPGAEAWGQGAATWFLTVLTPWERAFLAPRQVDSSVDRSDAYDLAQPMWQPQFHGDLASDPIDPPVIASRLWRLSRDGDQPELIPPEVALRVMFDEMATYPHDNGAPGIDMVDFADALACEALTEAQREHLRRSLVYPPTCRSL